MEVPQQHVAITMIPNPSMPMTADLQLVSAMILRGITFSIGVIVVAEVVAIMMIRRRGVRVRSPRRRRVTTRTFIKWMISTWMPRGLLPSVLTTRIVAVTRKMAAPATTTTTIARRNEFVSMPTRF